MRKPQNSIGNYPGSDIRALGSRPCDRIPAEHEGISIAIKTHRVEKIAAKVQNPFQPLLVERPCWWSVGCCLSGISGRKSPWVTCFWGCPTTMFVLGIQKHIGYIRASGFLARVTIQSLVSVLSGSGSKCRILDLVFQHWGCKASPFASRGLSP